MHTISWALAHPSINAFWFTIFSCEEWGFTLTGGHHDEYLQPWQKWSSGVSRHDPARAFEFGELVFLKKIVGVLALHEYIHIEYLIMAFADHID